MRAFVAISLSDEAKEHLLILQKRLRSGSFKISIAKGFHMTLKFLGDIPDDRIAKVKQHLRDVSFDHFDFYLDNMGFFPADGPVRVIWAGISPSEQVIRLQAGIDASLHDAGFAMEKNFHPHITLARVRDKVDKDALLEFFKKNQIEKVRTEVKSFSLFGSTLTPQGAVHEEIERFWLR